MQVSCIYQNLFVGSYNIILIVFLNKLTLKVKKTKYVNWPIFKYNIVYNMFFNKIIYLYYKQFIIYNFIINLFIYMFGG